MYACQLDYGFHHPLLRYEYSRYAEKANHVTCDWLPAPMSYYGQQVERLLRKLDELVMFEITKTPKVHLPSSCLRHPEVTQMMFALDTFTVPSTWTSYDNEVIAILKQVWEKQVKIDEEEEANDYAQQVVRLPEQMDRVPVIDLHSSK